MREYKQLMVLVTVTFVVGFVVLILLALDPVRLPGQELAWLLGGALMVVGPYGLQTVQRVRQVELPDRREMVLSGIERVWHSRYCDDAVTTVTKAIDECGQGEEILLAGVSLHDFLHDQGRYNESIENFLGRGGKLRVALSDPLSESAIERSRSEESATIYSESRLFKDMAMSMVTLAKMESQHPDRINAAFYRQPCRWFMVKAGRSLFYAGYRLAPPRPRSEELLSGELASFFQCGKGGVWSTVLADFEYLFDRYASNTLDDVARAITAMGLVDERGSLRLGRKGFGLDETEWVDKNSQDLAQYAGQWVAVSAQGQNVEIVAYGNSLDAVLTEARSRGIFKPFVVQVAASSAHD